MKTIKHLLLLLMAALVVVSCKEDEPDVPQAGSGKLGAYILNQGNQSNKIASTFSFFEYNTGGISHNIFSTTNGQSLGDGAQDGLIVNGKLYVSMHDNNLVWVIDPNTNKIKSQIKTNSPQGMATDGQFVYVTNNDGFVSKIDTQKDSVLARISVGPNPVDAEVRNGFLYVSVSDGYNFTNEYANGFKVSKINLNTFTRVVDLIVGMNPGQLTQDNKGNLFVVCNGNYGNVKAQVWKIDREDKAAVFCDANTIAGGDGVLYAINTVVKSWNPYSASNVFSVFDSNTGKEAAGYQYFAAKSPAPRPIAMKVHAHTGDVYITSDEEGYSSKGSVYVYNKAGEFKAKYEAGVHPYTVIFK